MQTVGFVGVGKIGMPISQNLIKSGYRVVGYRRGSLAEFEKIGGVPARSVAEVGEQADVVFSCLPSDAALEEVVQGPQGLIRSARPGQVVVELGSYPVPVKRKQIAPLAEKGAIFIDGEVAGTPGMVLARKGVIFIAGDEQACRKIEPVVAGFADFAFSTASISASSASSRMVAWAMRNRSKVCLARLNSVVIAARSETQRCARFSFDIQVSTATPTARPRPSVGNVGREWRFIVSALVATPLAHSDNAFEWNEVSDQRQKRSGLFIVQGPLDAGPTGPP